MSLVSVEVRAHKDEKIEKFGCFQIAPMDIAHQECQKKTSMCAAGRNIVFFTPGESSLLVYDTDSKNSETVEVEYPIVSIEYTPEKLVIFHEKLHKTYQVTPFEQDECVCFPAVISKFKVKNPDTVFYVRKNQLVIERRGKVVEKRQYGIARLIDGQYFLLVSGGSIEIYNGLGRVFAAPISTAESVYAGIWNNKIYILEGNRIYGHDLNLYLDVLRPFTPDRFVNLENEIILFDSARSDLRLYQKNLDVLLLQCEADDFIYMHTDSLLFAVSKGVFTVYRRRNPYLAEFQLIEKSRDYTETEDEFDESDPSYQDIE